MTFVTRFKNKKTRKNAVFSHTREFCGTKKDFHSAAVEVYGRFVDIYGEAVEVYGGSVELYGVSVELYGVAVELYGVPVELYGEVVEVYGKAVEHSSDAEKIYKSINLKKNWLQKKFCLNLNGNKKRGNECRVFFTLI
jgi:hypothetical protein